MLHHMLHAQHIAYIYVILRAAPFTAGLFWLSYIIVCFCLIVSVGSVIQTVMHLTSHKTAPSQDATPTRRHFKRSWTVIISLSSGLWIPGLGSQGTPLGTQWIRRTRSGGGIQLFVSPIGQPFEIMTKMELPHLICVISSIPTPPHPICWPHASLSPPHPTPKRIDGCILLTQHLT